MLIPRIGHIFWDGPARPDYVEQSIASWRELHPNWTFLMWDEESLPRLRNQDLYDSWETVSPASKEWQYKTDIARLELVHDIGGCWIDADAQALRNIEPLISDCEAFAARESDEFVNNGFFGATPGHPWVADMITAVRLRIMNNPKWRSNKQAGPWMFTEAIKHHPDVRILPHEQTHPSRWDELDKTPDDFPDAYVFSWWNNKRSQQKR